jgi:exoribonuclease-2
MSLEGHIIEFLDTDQLRVAYVRRQEHEKLQVIDPRGRNLTINGDRVVIVHRPVSEADFPGIARGIVETVATLQSQIDVELLWHALAGNPRELLPSELAGVFFSERTPEAASAVFRALGEDNVFFKRKGLHFAPKTHDQVQTEIVRRQRQKEHQAFRDRASHVIERLVRRKDVRVTPEMEPIVDRIHNWFRTRSGDEIGVLMEEIAGPVKARDAAYDILLRAGRIDARDDRFLLMAGIDEQHPQAVLDAAERIAPHVHSADRVDYRHLPAFTVDDEDTREVDDALTVERSGDEVIVGIHIADVSSFVSKGDALDAEAARRSSTIYLPSVRVRMFPERLSTDLASLTAGQPKPTLTVEVRFDREGNRTGYRMVLGTILVGRRLSYDEADNALESGDPDLRVLHGIATLLQTARAQKGAITFRRPELKVRVANGDIEVHKIDPNSPSRFLVSEMMILANGLAADFASVNSVPVIFRTQEAREALAIDDSPVIEAVAFERLRKTFKRSRLSLTPGTHSGLGLSAYTQASSPIRRYADLVTQRQFTSFLSGRSIPHSRDELLRILASAEATEQEIRAIEEKSTHYWLLEYLAREKSVHPDRALQAFVLDRKGTVELEDFYLRGKLPAATSSFEPGTSVRLIIDSIDPAAGDIHFRLADHA